MRKLILFMAAGCLGQACAPAPAPEAASPIPPEADSIVQEVAVPAAAIDFDTTAWVELVPEDAEWMLDLKYATTDNFVKQQLYDCPRCFLRPDAAAAIRRIQTQLNAEGLGLKFFDCYRPRPIQWKLWEIVPDKRYVADPKEGSMHNRGVAVDLTIVDSVGNELDMGTPFDFFGKEAWHEYQDLPEVVLSNRLKLKAVMEANGFKAIRTEWWHYSYGSGSHPLDDFVWPCPD